MKNKHKKFIAIIYFTVIILGVIFYYTIPKENFVKANTGEGAKQSDYMAQEILDYLHGLPDKSLENKYNIKSYNFNYEGKDLEIALSKKQHEQVFIDRKNSDDNKIEVYRYSGHRAFKYVDLSNLIKAPNIQLINNKLNIEYKKQEYVFTRFSKDVVINQFYEKQDDENNNGFENIRRAILYIKIPKNLKILEDEAYEYINR